MQRLIGEAGLEWKYKLDSAGTAAYHEGELADSRMRMHASRRGYNLTHRSRPVRVEDFYDFDLILAMDDSNVSNLKRIAPSPEEEKKIRRMTDYCTTHDIDHVPDPYYGGDKGFEFVIDLLEDACAGLLNRLENGVW